MQCKKGVYFHLILLGIPSSMIMSVKNRGWGQRAGEFYLTEKICYKLAKIYLLMGPNID